MSCTYIKPWFFRFGAVSALFGALAVLAAQLLLTIDTPTTSTADVIGIYGDSVYRAKAGTILIQVGLMFLAFIALMAKIGPRSPSLVLLALPFLLFWQIFELFPRSIDLFAASYQWAPEYLDASHSDIRATVEERFRAFWSASEAIGEIRRICWMVLHFLIGAALWRVGGLAKIVSTLLWINSLRLAVAIAGAHFGFGWVAGGLAGFIVVIVPQFLLIAVWLWLEPFSLEREASGAPHSR